MACRGATKEQPLLKNYISRPAAPILTISIVNLFLFVYIVKQKPNSGFHENKSGFSKFCGNRMLVEAKELSLCHKL